MHKKGEEEERVSSAFIIVTVCRYYCCCDGHFPAWLRSHSFTCSLAHSFVPCFTGSFCPVVALFFDGAISTKQRDEQKTGTKQGRRCTLYSSSEWSGGHRE